MPRSSRGEALALSALVALALALFLPVLDSGFVSLDDGMYVTANPPVAAGLTTAGVRWALTSVGHAGNWHPLAWLSHMLDVELFGLDPRGHHATSLALHAANTALLFLLLRRLTGALLPSAAVAALFCAHPAHVETVAWVADRKGLLSTLFWLLAASAWLSHRRAPRPRRYAAALLLFAAALASKPMAVGFPLTLLVLDRWPLGRRPSPRLLVEKVPFFLLAGAGGALTLAAQQAGGAVSFAGGGHAALRAANAVVSWFDYLRILLRPAGLAVLYPYPSGYPAAGRLAAAAGALLAVTAAAILLRRRAPAVAAGWGWFLATTIPVIGIVQVGSAPLADRYTYVPFVGLFVAGVWGARALLSPVRRRGLAPAVAALVGLAALAGMTRVQLGHWRDAERLLAHAVAVSPGDGRLHAMLADVLLAGGRPAEAAGHFAAALRARPDDRGAAYGLGQALKGLGRLGEAAEALRRSVRIDPAFAEGWNGLGVVLGRQGRVREAAACFEAAARLDPGNEAARENLAAAQRLLGR